MIGEAHDETDFKELRGLEGKSERKTEPCFVVDGFVNLHSYEEGEDNKSDGNWHIKLPELCHEMIVKVRKNNCGGKTEKLSQNLNKGNAVADIKGYRLVGINKGILAKDSDC